MNTAPKQLSDLKSQDNVLHLKQSQMVSAEANRYFKEVLDDTRHVYIREIFIEDNKKVFEAYTDLGSVDYLYIVQ